MRSRYPPGAPGAPGGKRPPAPRCGSAASTSLPARVLPEAALFEVGAGPPLLDRVVALEDQLVAHPPVQVALLEEPPQVLDLGRLTPLDRLAEPLDDLSTDVA